MPDIPCPATCDNGVPYTDWITYAPLYQKYLLYCALVAAGNLPEDPEMLRGVYTNSTNANYVAPADASLIIWNVPGQTATRTITFSGAEGQYTAVVIVSSNGQLVNEATTTAFSLSSPAHLYALVAMTATPGTVLPITGTAGQYNIGTSGVTVPLLSTSNTFGAPQAITSNTGSTALLTGTNANANFQSYLSLLNNLGHINNLAVTGSTSAFGEPFFADCGYLFTDAANGLSVISSAGQTRFYANGITPSHRVLRLEAGGGPVTVIARVGNASATPQLHIDGPVGTNRSLFWDTSGSLRWGLYADDLAEAGSNVGTGFWLTAFNDAGVGLGDCFYCPRDTQHVILGGDYGGIPTDQGGTLQVLGTTEAQASGVTFGLQVMQTLNQSGTAGNTALLINTTETSTGSGSQLHIDAQTGGVSAFSVDTAGTVLANGNIEATSAESENQGFVMKSPDGTRWLLKVSNIGLVTAVAAP